MDAVDIIQIVIGILSLVATVAVSFAIYWLQTRHEKEIQRIAEENEKKRIKEEADRFLIDNEAERDYLPLCIFASNLHRHEKHTRAIYTNFCRCNKELQDEILSVAEFKCRTIDGTEWLDKAIDKLKEDMKKYNLGSPEIQQKEMMLYDGAKYFHRGYEYYRENKWDYGYRNEFEPIVEDRAIKVLTGNSLISISAYVDDYIYFIVEKHDNVKVKENPLPPMDYLWEAKNLYVAAESDVCGWMIEIIDAITVIIHNKTIKRDEDLFHDDLTDGQPETFEDKYYETVRALYYTYIA